MFSCSVQGLIPYGAQMLLAAGFAKVSPVEIIPFTFYPMLTAVCGIIAIVIGFPRLNKNQNHLKKLRNIKPLKEHSFKGFTV